LEKKPWVNAVGFIQVDRHIYYVGQALAGSLVLVHLVASHALFHISLNGDRVKALDIKGLHRDKVASQSR